MKITKYIGLAFLVILFSVGCEQSEPRSTKKTKPSSKKEQVKTPKPEKKQPVKLDKFGRSPDHPHYGHNHTVGGHGQPQNADSTVQSTGKPDKFGRPPGHPHYGHNHR